MKFCFIFLSILLATCTNVHAQDVSFDNYIEAFKQKARSKGISDSTINTAFDDLYLLNSIIELDKKQPEKKLTKEEYLAKVINQTRINQARKLFADNRELLTEIGEKYGVDPEFIVALWGLETGFGKNQGNYDVVEVLTTLAYEGRRREFFESELLAALIILEEGHISHSRFKGSWAGAMGQCQFMPSSYLAYGADGDGDGKIDIWKNKKDVFSSIANYLSTVGWGSDQETKTKALMHWNRSTYFVASVFMLAGEIENEM
jgi:membrane-bound lytic murein transglycosylase B